MGSPSPIKLILFSLWTLCGVSTRLASGQSYHQLNYTAHVGERVTLLCDIPAGPNTRIIWYKELFDGSSQRLSPGQTLLFPNVSLSDAGDYQCMPDTPMYNTSQTISLDVTSEPIIELPTRHHRVPVGVQVTLECIVTANPLDYMYWTRNGRLINVQTIKYASGKIRTDIYTYILSVKFHVVEGDYGQYSCFASNQYGHTMRSVTISDPTAYANKVQMPPKSKIALQNSDVQFDCVVSEGFTTFDWLIWWYIASDGTVYRLFAAQLAKKRLDMVHVFPRKYTIRGFYSLIVREIEFTDSGQYVCSVRDQRNHTATLTVVEKTVCGSRNSNVTEEQEAYLWCSHRAEGPMAIWDAVWMHNKRKMPSVKEDVTGLVLRTLIFLAKLEDKGTYVCELQALDPPYKANCSIQLGVASRDTIKVQPPDVTPAPIIAWLGGREKNLGFQLIVMTGMFLTMVLAVLFTIHYYRSKLSSDRQAIVPADERMVIEEISIGDDFANTPRSQRYAHPIRFSDTLERV